MKRLKYIILVVVALCLSSVFAATNYKINFDGKNIPMMVEPINESNSLLVGLREVFETLGANVSWDNNDKSISIRKDDVFVYLKIDDTIAYVDGEPIYMSVSPRLRNGTTYIPVRFVSEAIGYEVAYNSAIKTVEIKTVTKERTMPTFKDNLVFEEAVKMAIKNNSDIKSLNRSIDYAEDQLNYSSHIADRMLTGGGNVQYISPQLEMMFAQIDALDNTVKTSEHTKKLLEKTSEFMVYNTMLSIKESQMNLHLLEISKEVAELNFSTLKNKYDAGLESEYNVETARLNNEQLRVNIDNMNTSIDNLYLSLNYLIAKSGKDKYNVLVDYSYEPLQISDIDSYADNLAKNDLNVKILEVSEEIAKRGLTQISETSSYEQNKLAYDNAVAKAANAKKDTAKNVKSQYSTIKALEGTIESQKIEIKKAETDYNNMKTQFNLGYLTKVAVMQAEMNVIKQKYTLEQLYIKHCLSVYMMENPFLLSGGQ